MSCAGSSVVSRQQILTNGLEGAPWRCSFQHFSHGLAAGSEPRGGRWRLWARMYYGATLFSSPTAASRTGSSLHGVKAVSAWALRQTSLHSPRQPVKDAGRVRDALDNAHHSRDLVGTARVNLNSVLHRYTKPAAHFPDPAAWEPSPDGHFSASTKSNSSHRFVISTSLAADKSSSATPEEDHGQHVGIRPIAESPVESISG
ncbi:uncharacterized protein B0I36DRAFT_348370 [Microdochium trichocladiopsis]|uniref:Uncharacterized protein n=1 Tax=Microdochium trichocladiopsis TaxID=1682393 RepID=A0A9P9BRY2_9PEZI|nr:uncharacterized protein B0I36DRAFT_348370 [Microdochium trichocladiopsis]KAH7033295.1 hypothetical protein B0I36DRAFT_348370 [Microdochium trichocladiopsis]